MELYNEVISMVKRKLSPTAGSEKFGADVRHEENLLCTWEDEQPVELR